MPPERLPPDDPREWLNRALSNLERAKAHAGLRRVYLEDLCFDAQQAAEKAIKAVLLFHQVPFPPVHDLGQLLTLLMDRGGTVPESVKEAIRLTRYAVATRYPGVSEVVAPNEYRDAVAIAEAVTRWAESIIPGA